MSRIKIDLPEKFQFTTQIPVRITDLNYGSHLGNDSVLSIIHEARVQYLTSLGYSELDLAGVGLIMADVAIEFLQEAFYGDIIQASIAAGDIKRVSFDLFYLLEITRNGKTTPIAKAKTGMVCYDYKQKKVTSLPEEAAEKLV